MIPPQLIRRTLSAFALLTVVTHAQGVLDGGFEGLTPGSYPGNAQIGSWSTFGGAAIDNTLAHSGTQSLTLFGLSSAGQQVSTVPGVRYEFSFWSRTSGQGEINQPIIRVSTGFGAETGFRLSDTWSVNTSSFVATGDKTSIGFIADVKLQVDDVTLTAIPEPTTVAFLATGAAMLAVVVRRRRA